MMGHQVEIARNGTQGISAAWHTLHPMSFLLDISRYRVTYMDGYQVVRDLCEQPCTQRTLIIALSGYATDKNALCVRRWLALIIT